MIISSAEIIKKVAKDLGYSEMQVESVYDSIVAYIKKLVIEKDTVAIRLPYIGVLYATVQGLIRKDVRFRARSINHTSYYEKHNKDIHTVVQSKLKRIYDYIDAHKGEKGYHDNKHFKKLKITLKYFNGGKSIKEIEAIQNEKSK